MLSMLHLQANLLCDLSVHLAPPRAVAHESGDHTGLLLKLVLPATGGTKSDGKRMLSWALLVPSTKAGQRKKRQWDQHQSNVHPKVLLCLNQGTPAPKPQRYGSFRGCRSPSLAAEVISPSIKSYQTDHVTQKTVLATVLWIYLLISPLA